MGLLGVIMGVLDALTILGAGVGRGYRGSQELQRQMAEQKRKALLEEREQIVRETTAKSQQALQEAQIQTEALNRAIGQFGLDVNKRKEARGATPITQGGAPLRMNMLGQNVSVPGDVQSLTDMEGLLKQLSDERYHSEHPEYFTNYPPVGTKAAEIKLSPAARKIDYILKASGVATGGGPTQFEDPEDYAVRIAKTFEYIFGQMKEADPEAFSAIKKAALDDTPKVNPNAAEDDTSWFNDPAIEPDSTKGNSKGKKNNRFTNVKVKP